MKNGIDVQEQHEQLPSLYWLLKLHKKLIDPSSLLLPNNALQNSFHLYLLLVLKLYLLLINNILMIFITTLGRVAFGLTMTQFGAILSIPNLSSPNTSTIPNFFSTRLKAFSH